MPGGKPHPPARRCAARVPPRHPPSRSGVHQAHRRRGGVQQRELNEPGFTRAGRGEGKGVRDLGALWSRRPVREPGDNLRQVPAEAGRRCEAAQFPIVFASGGRGTAPQGQQNDGRHGSDQETAGEARQNAARPEPVHEGAPRGAVRTAAKRRPHAAAKGKGKAGGTRSEATAARRGGNRPRERRRGVGARSSWRPSGGGPSDGASRSRRRGGPTAAG